MSHYDVLTEVKEALKTKKVSRLQVGDRVIFDNVIYTVEYLEEVGNNYIIEFRTPAFKYRKTILSLQQEVLLG